jgi:hypothetical protein
VQKGVEKCNPKEEEENKWEKELRKQLKEEYNEHYSEDLFERRKAQIIRDEKRAKKKQRKLEKENFKAQSAKRKEAYEKNKRSRAKRKARKKAFSLQNAFNDGKCTPQALAKCISVFKEELSMDISDELKPKTKPLLKKTQNTF